MGSHSPVIVCGMSSEQALSLTETLHRLRCDSGQDADPDIPILKEARAEYAKLK